MIELRLFGGLRLRDSEDGREIGSVLARGKPSALLVYLALSPPESSHSRDVLVGLLWPNVDRERARSSLNQAIYVLRRGLGPRIINTRENGDLALEAGSVWCDVTEFERVLAEGDEARALEFYDDRFWTSPELSECRELEAWLDATHARVRTLAISAALTLADELESAESPIDAVHWLRRAGEWAPYDESILRRRLRVVAGVGDRTAALRDFEVFRERLGADLDIEPSAETLALVEELRTDEAPAPAAALAHDPAPGPGVPDPHLASPVRVAAEPETVRVFAEWRRPSWGWVLAIAIVIPAAMVGVRAMDAGAARATPDWARNLPLAFTDRDFPYFEPEETPPTMAWIAFSGSRSVVLAGGGRDFTIEWATQLPGGTYDVALSPDGRTAYVGVGHPRPGLAVIDTETREWKHIPTGVFRRDESTLSAIDVSPDGADVYVIDATTNSLLVFNTERQTFERELRLPGEFPQLSAAQDLLVVPNGDTLYTIALGLLSMVDPETWSVVRTYDTPRPAESLTLLPDGETAYVGHNGAISVLDLVSGDVLAHVELQGELQGDSYRHGVAVSPDGSRVYANPCCRSLLVFSTETHQVIDSIRVSPGPGDVAVSPDGRYVWVANASSDRVTVIDVETSARSFTSSLPGSWPAGLSVAPTPR